MKGRGFLPGAISLETRLFLSDDFQSSVSKLLAWGNVSLGLNEKKKCKMLFKAFEE